MRRFHALLYVTAAVLLCSDGGSAATVTIVPTNLDGATRPNGTVTIIRAVDQNNRAVNVDANLARRRADNNEIEIIISDSTVRAITIVVSAGGALNSNHQTLFVVDQRVVVALPNAEQAECPCCVQKAKCCNIRGLLKFCCK